MENTGSPPERARKTRRQIPVIPLRFHKMGKRGEKYRGVQTDIIRGLPAQPTGLTSMHMELNGMAVISSQQVAEL